jgi:hypothetical protein
MFSAKRKLVAGAAGLVVLAGTGGAYAATQNGSSGTKPDPATEQKAFLDDLANRLHVSTDQLSAAIKGAAEDRIDAAVTAGRLTKAQGDAAKQRIESATGLPLLGVGPGILGGLARPGDPGMGLRFGFGPGKSLDAAATFLGLTEAQLRTELSSGKSLADVAKAKGKSTDDLKAAMKTAITSELDQAVKDGKLTDAQRTQIEKDLDTRLDNLISGKAPERPMFGGFHRWR